MDAARAHNTDTDRANDCPHCVELAAEVARLREALVEIRRWSIEATHP